MPLEGTAAAILLGCSLYMYIVTLRYLNFKSLLVQAFALNTQYSGCCFLIKNNVVTLMYKQQMVCNMLASMRLMVKYIQ